VVFLAIRHFRATGRGGTVNTTSPLPVLPAASVTFSTSTYVPGFSAFAAKQ
jgi:hypothetical protein